MKQALLLLIPFAFNATFSQKLLDVHYYSLFGKVKSFQFLNIRIRKSATLRIIDNHYQNLNH